MYIKTTVNRLYDYDGKAFVIFIGPFEKSDQKNVSNFFSITKKLELINYDLSTIPLKYFTRGIHIVINQEFWKENVLTISSFLKDLSRIFSQFVYHPALKSTVPDPLNVRNKANNLNFYHLMVQAQNIPYYLQFPICNKLKGIARGLPVLILTPGPSLKKNIEHVYNNQGKVIIITVPKCLEICTKYNIIPDFVVHQDTGMQQRYFYLPELDTSQSCLIALSKANIKNIAERFCYVFFIDNFDSQLQSSDFHLKRSPLSTQTTCLRLAEHFNASEIIFCGADLSYKDKDQIYCNNNHTTDIVNQKYPPDIPIQINQEPASKTKKWSTFCIPDRNFDKTHTELIYYATAGYIENTAVELKKYLGINSYNLGNEGILNPKIIPSVYDLSTYKSIRKDYLKKEILQRQSIKPEINLHKYKAHLLHLKKYASDTLLYFEVKAREDVKSLFSHPVFISLSETIDSKRLHYVDSNEDLVKMTADMLKAWIKYIENGLKELNLKIISAKKGQIAVFCKENELEYFSEKFSALYPFSKPLFHTVTQNGEQNSKFDRSISYLNLIFYMKTLDAVLVSKEFSKDYKTEFEFYGLDPASI